MPLKDWARAFARATITVSQNKGFPPSFPSSLVRTPFSLVTCILRLPTRFPSINNVKIRIQLQSQILQLPPNTRAQYFVFLFRPSQDARKVCLAVGRGCIEHVLLLVESNLFLSTAFRPGCCWDLLISLSVFKQPLTNGK